MFFFPVSQVSQASACVLPALGDAATNSFNPSSSSPDSSSSSSFIHHRVAMANDPTADEFVMDVDSDDNHVCPRFTKGGILVVDDANTINASIHLASRRIRDNLVVIEASWGTQTDDVPEAEVKEAQSTTKKTTPLTSPVRAPSSRVPPPPPHRSTAAETSGLRVTDLRLKLNKNTPVIREQISSSDAPAASATSTAAAAPAAAVPDAAAADNASE